MICGLVAPRAHWDYERLFGTWDFKWPAGKTIRVAFQRLPADLGVSDSEFARLTEKVETLAKTWLVEKPPVAFEFKRSEEDWLPAPEQGAERGRSWPGGKYVRYDVLVSLAPLGIPFSYDVKVAVDPPRGAQLWRLRHVTTEARSKRSLEIALQTSQLGRFALRCDYGVPTVYLGQPKRPYPTAAAGVISKSGLQPGGTAVARGKGIAVSSSGDFKVLELPKKGQSLREYYGFQSPTAASTSTGSELADSKTLEFEEAVVHEFGHVLGVPHLHQSPLLESGLWKDNEDIIAILQDGVGVALDPAFVETQITLPHPSTASRKQLGKRYRSGADFSDWTKPHVDAAGRPIDSVMTHPFMGALFEVPRDPLLERFEKPREPDLAFLREMYA